MKLSDEPGYVANTPGCYQTRHAWSCTVHIEYKGKLLHVAAWAYADRVGAAWFDGDEFFGIRSSGNTVSDDCPLWEEFKMNELPPVFTQEDLEEAGKSLQRMVKEMEAPNGAGRQRDSDAPRDGYRKWIVESSDLRRS